MKITLNQSDIADLLRKDDHAGWSYKGANALAEWLDENLDENEEFDAVAIRCEWSEYESAFEAAGDNGWEDGEDGDEEDEDEETKNQAAFEWLESRTLVLEIEVRARGHHSGGGVIIGTNF
jgi:hypothetical protein